MLELERLGVRVVSGRLGRGKDDEEGDESDDGEKKSNADNNNMGGGNNNMMGGNNMGGVSIEEVRFGLVHRYLCIYRFKLIVLFVRVFFHYFDFR